MIPFVEIMDYLKVTMALEDVQDSLVHELRVCRRRHRVVREFGQRRWAAQVRREVVDETPIDSDGLARVSHRLQLLRAVTHEANAS